MTSPVSVRNWLRVSPSEKQHGEGGPSGQSPLPILDPLPGSPLRPSGSLHTARVDADRWKAEWRWGEGRGKGGEIWGIGREVANGKGKDIG